MNRYFILAGILLISTSSMARPFKKSSPASALEFQQATDSRIAVEAGYIRFFTGNTERMTMDANGNLGIGTSSPAYAIHLSKGEPVQFRIENNGILAKVGVNNSGGYLSATDGSGNVDVSLKGYGVSYINSTSLGIGTTDPGSYKLNVNGSIMAANSLDIGEGRPAGTDDKGLYIKGTGGSPTNFQFASKSWSSSHAILFNAYKSATQSNGNLAVTGNTKYTTNGDNDRGAAMIHYYGHNGGMGFYISGQSTGIDDDITWGTPKIHIQRNGNVGINIFDPTDAKLHVYRDATTGGWGGPMDETKAVARFEDSGSNLYVDGNALLSDGHLQVGTIANKRLTFGTNDNERVRITESGKVGIGKTSPTHELDVLGTIRGTDFISTANSYADFVFEDDYQLPSLRDVENYINKNNHLPDIPSEAEAKANGVNLQEMQAKLLQKIEELTLYVIDLKKENEEQQERISKLEQK